MRAARSACTSCPPARIASVGRSTVYERRSTKAVMAWIVLSSPGLPWSQYPPSAVGRVTAVQSSRSARQRAGRGHRSAGSELPMKALVKVRAEAGLWVEDVPVPAVGRDDVLIRVLRTGVCGTDLHIYEWDGWAQDNVPVPLVIGHEFAGEIVELGSDVRDLAVGDLVSGEGHLVCGRCPKFIVPRRGPFWHSHGE